MDIAVNGNSGATRPNRTLLVFFVAIMLIMGRQILVLHNRVSMLQVALLMESALSLAVERGTSPSDVERDLRSFDAKVYRRGNVASGTYELECAYVEKGSLLLAPIVIYGTLYYVDGVSKKWDRVVRHQLNTP